MEKTSSKKQLAKCLEDSTDIVEILQNVQNYDVSMGLVNKITLNGINKLFTNQDSFFLLIDFVLIKHSLSGEDKEYKDFRTDLRGLFTEIKKAIELNK